MSDSIIPKEILKTYQSLVRTFSEKINNEEKKEIKKSFETAYLAHKGIKR